MTVAVVAVVVVVVRVGISICRCYWGKREGGDTVIAIASTVTSGAGSIYEMN